MAELITDIEQVTPKWLTELFRQKSILAQGKIASVEVREPTSKFYSAVYHLTLTYSDDAYEPVPTRLFLKFSQSNLEPEFSSREVDFYNLVAASMLDAPVPQCYDAVYSPKTGKYHILLDQTQPF